MFALYAYTIYLLRRLNTAALPINGTYISNPLYLSVYRVVVDHRFCPFNIRRKVFLSALWDASSVNTEETFLDIKF